MDFTGLFSEYGLLGLMFALSLMANVFQYRQKLADDKERRQSDRDMMERLFGAIDAIRNATALLKEGRK